MLTPTEQQWLKAAEILHRLRRREHYEAAKLRELAFDVLIALSARSIGASVIVNNHADFLAIQSAFEFKSPEDFPKHSPLQFETPLSLKNVYSCLCSASFAEHAVKFSSLEDSAVKALMTTSLIIRGVARCSPGMGLVFPLCSNHTSTDVHGF